MGDACTQYSEASRLKLQQNGQWLKQYKQWRFYAPARVAQPPVLVQPLVFLATNYDALYYPQFGMPDHLTPSTPVFQIAAVRRVQRHTGLIHRFLFLTFGRSGAQS